MKCVAVAVSGGRDSTALLHCTRAAAAAQGVQVLALHVHHGLQAQADDWWSHLRAQCRRWGVQFIGTRLLGAPAAGESVEAWARRERYRALGTMAKEAGCSLVLLAHHRRDQAETFLLQALRGGGVKGLSAMPRLKSEAGVVWARPWLDMPRQNIEAYVRRFRIRHIEDASNGDARFARNRLRLQVWPALEGAFADVELTLCSAAKRAQEAAALAHEVAVLDLPTVQQGNALHVARWLTLPDARRRNALRAWLTQALDRDAPHQLVDRLLRELPASQSAQWQAPDGVLHLYRGLLVATAIESQSPEPDTKIELDLSRPGQCPVPMWQGRFVVAPVQAGGIEPAALARVYARPRAGGEQFQFGPRGTARSLKKQYQARGVASHDRQGPLLFSAQGQLLFAPGLGVPATAQARVGEPQLTVTWQPDR